MHVIDKETEWQVLDANTDEDYDVSQELEYWTVQDFKDVLPS